MKTYSPKKMITDVQVKIINAIWHKRIRKDRELLYEIIYTHFRYAERMHDLSFWDADKLITMLREFAGNENPNTQPLMTKRQLYVIKKACVDLSWCSRDAAETMPQIAPDALMHFIQKRNIVKRYWDGDISTLSVTEARAVIAALFALLSWNKKKAEAQ